MKQNKKQSQNLATRQDAAKAPEVQATFVMAPDFKQIYVNFVQASFTPFDIGLMMGEVVGLDEHGHQIVQQKARVTMAAMEAKIVMLILANTLKAYEGQFGRIIIPDNLAPTIKSVPEGV